MQNSSLKKYIELHIIIFIWGFTAILGKLISIDALALVWYRMAITTACIAIYFIFTKKSFKITLKEAFIFTFTGAIIASHWITFFHAIKVSNISVTLVTLSTGALFTSLIEPLLFKRKIDPLEIVFGIIIVGGIAIIFNIENNYIEGIIYALIAAFLSALFSVFNGLYAKKYSADIISLYQMLFGAAFVSVFMLFSGDLTVANFTLNSSDLIYLLILGGICTAYPSIAIIKLMRDITPYTILLSINLEPIYAIILAILIFGESEQMSSMFYIGALIIFATVVAEAIIKNIRKKRAKKKQITSHSALE